MIVFLHVARFISHRDCFFYFVMLLMFSCWFDPLILHFCIPFSIFEFQLYLIPETHLIES